jgi:hypothetical protein
MMHPTDLKAHLHDGHFTFTVTNDKLEHYTYRLLARPSKYKEGSFYYYAKVCKMPGVKGSPDLRQKPGESDTDFRDRMTEMSKRWRWNCIGLFDTRTAPLAIEKKDWADFTDESLEFKVAQFGLRIITGKQALPPGYAVEMATFCRKCGRLIWEPVSRAAGFGPECRKQLGIAA